jgi:tRNA/rRNA methyltransferase
MGVRVDLTGVDLRRVDLSNTRIVLVEPAGARNVGSIARVMKNMGLTQLVMVNPECDPLGEEARMMAVHGLDVLESAWVVPDLASALEGCHRVAATVGRDGVLRSVENLRSVVPWILGESGVLEFHDRGTPAETSGEMKGYLTSAIVFGREDHGLSNDQLKYAQRLVTIPSNPDYPSPWGSWPMSCIRRLKTGRVREALWLNDRTFLPNLKRRFK